ncbi:MAG TPA: SIR2 family protein [Kofleriaceae bacterium]|nr:SIR2 family protein [Kofleriaceae bacterium]
MDERERTRELAAIIASGEAALFTGAGFSAEAFDRSGRSLPDSREMIAELWSQLFGDEPADDSSLADLYDVALIRAPERLRDYLRTRLQIGDSTLPPTFASWFSAPWSRIYTLNVDDLEVAVARQFALPRPLVSVSALAKESPKSPENALEVVHLNGMASDDPTQVTFSTMQYASRLCSEDHAYESLVEDLRSRSFVFVGTTLDEVVLWKHVQLERQRGGGAPRKHSFLISPSLTRARQVLLESVKIHWIRGTAGEIAERVLARL